MTDTIVERLTPERLTRACQHSPACPSAAAMDHDAALVIARHPEQGWWLLCNGVVVFDDTGELLPDRQSIPPHRASSRRWSATVEVTAA